MYIILLSIHIGTSQSKNIHIADRPDSLINVQTKPLGIDYRDFKFCTYRGSLNNVEAH